MSTASAGAAAEAHEVCADTSQLSHFVDQGNRYVGNLQSLHDEVRRVRAEVMGQIGSHGPPSCCSLSTLQDLITEVSTNNGFVEQIRDSLLCGIYAPDLEARILSGELAPPTDDERNRVLAAMVAGLAPGRSGIDSDAELHRAYFPSSYRRFHALGRHIEEAEQDREVADGSSWAWWDNDDEALAAIDKQLAVMRREQRELADQLGIDGGSIDRFSAMAAISETTAGYRWEGEAYADHFVGFHETKISDGSWLFGTGEGNLRETSGNSVELGHIGRRVAANPETALAFYNGIGVGRTANLPSFLVGNDLSQDEFNNYGRALASASLLVTPTGRPKLQFSGDALVAHERPGTQDGVVWYNPALLFVAGRFESSFLAEAAGAVLAMAEAGNEQGLLSHIGHDSVATLSGGTAIHYNGGEDPRNILLDRASTDPVATMQIVAALGGPQGRGWQGAPLSRSLDPLLKPRSPFDATIGPNPDVYWLDRLADLGNIADPSHPAVSPIAYPSLTSEYPIAAFLAAAADHDTLARWLLLYTADSLAAEGAMAQDPGTAVGLDLLLARHATLMFDPADLDALEIEQTGLNHGAPVPVEAKHWRAVHSEVLRYGRGQALAMRTEELLEAAIVGAIDHTGRVNGDPIRPFAQMAALTEAEAYRALFAYSAQLDDDARSKNRKANIAVSAALAVAGLGAGAVGGLTASGASVGWSTFFDGYPTTAELEVYRIGWETVYYEEKSERWKTIAASRALEVAVAKGNNDGFASMEMFVPDLGWRDVTIRPDDEGDDSDDHFAAEGLGYIWQHPSTMKWQQIPMPTFGSFYAHFPPMADGSLSKHRATVALIEQVVEENYVDGKLRSLQPSGARSEEMIDALDDTTWTVDWIVSR
ncbi:MAG: hypothetical protein ACRBK7_15225 [Acidimicrobiales bacterium]